MIKFSSTILSHRSLLALTAMSLSHAKGQTTEECYFQIKGADKNKDDALDRDEFVTATKILGVVRNVFIVGFNDLPEVMKRAFQELSCRDTQTEFENSQREKILCEEDEHAVIDIRVVPPSQQLPDKVEGTFLDTCDVIKKALMNEKVIKQDNPNLRTAKAFTDKNLAMNMALGMQPAVTPKSQLITSTLRPTRPLNQCFIGMLTSDSIRNNRMEKDEYVPFLNFLEPGAFENISFNEISEDLRNNFENLADDDGSIKLGEIFDPSEEEKKFLEQVCEDTNNAITAYLNLPSQTNSPSKTQSSSFPSSVPSSLPSTYPSTLSPITQLTSTLSYFPSMLPTNSKKEIFIPTITEDIFKPSLIINPSSQILSPTILSTISKTPSLRPLSSSPSHTLSQAPSLMTNNTGNSDVDPAFRPFLLIGIFAFLLSTAFIFYFLKKKYCKSNRSKRLNSRSISNIDEIDDNSAGRSDDLYTFDDLSVAKWSEAYSVDKKISTINESDSYETGLGSRSEIGSDFVSLESENGWEDTETISTFGDGKSSVSLAAASHSSKIMTQVILDEEDEVLLSSPISSKLNSDLGSTSDPALENLTKNEPRSPLGFTAKSKNYRQLSDTAQFTDANRGEFQQVKVGKSVEFPGAECHTGKLNDQKDIEWKGPGIDQLEIESVDEKKRLTYINNGSARIPEKFDRDKGESIIDDLAPEKQIEENSCSSTSDSNSTSSSPSYASSSTYESYTSTSDDSKSETNTGGYTSDVTTEESPKSSKSSSIVESGLEKQGIRDEIQVLARKIVPGEADQINAMMDKFKGREKELYHTLKRMEERSVKARARAAVHKSKACTPIRSSDRTRYYRNKENSTDRNLQTCTSATCWDSDVGSVIVSARKINATASFESSTTESSLNSEYEEYEVPPE